ncbi:MAG: hypothetical protein M9938_08805 [Solirubrobacterales bacterium]|nr:hypothetical protein [Solirubrobacterales bacterium]
MDATDREINAYRNGMLGGMPQVAIRISKEEMDLLDRLVAEGRFGSRAEAVREGLAVLAREIENRSIADSYRDAYERRPPDDWFAEASGELLDERLSRSSDQQDEP